MTTPNQTTPQDNRASETVDLMIARLRELQGSGEYPPLGRRITAGAGLEGGGTLETDVTLRLPAETVTLLEELTGLDLSTLVNDEDLTRALQGRLTASDLAPRVYYRDFTVTDAPLSTVTAPLIRADAAATITRITVVVGTPGSQPVVVRAAGHRVTVTAGAEATTSVVEIARADGQSIPVTVEATDAAGIVVSLRMEEVATK
ncbi:hypothetical protein [Corynebacterium humireducens]|uniref:hypothetical protein n=1 Tax=Corynebacterium humireducens TaxID=1223514 RepID=UPI000589D250|nr:hypothetical protein [Corynebacterium humireducens]